TVDRHPRRGGGGRWGLPDRQDQFPHRGPARCLCHSGGRAVAHRCPRRIAVVIGEIERIVVSLDAVSENQVAVEAAARLALRWNAALHGVFVEDGDLLRLAGLPFARQVSLGAGAAPLTAAPAARQLRAFAESARREVAA